MCIQHIDIERNYYSHEMKVHAKRIKLTCDLRVMLS